MTDDLPACGWLISLVPPKWQGIKPFLQNTGRVFAFFHLDWNVGIEPTAYWLGVNCSTIWANFKTCCSEHVLWFHRLLTDKMPLATCLSATAYLTVFKATVNLPTLINYTNALSCGLHLCATLCLSQVNVLVWAWSNTTCWFMNLHFP